MCRLNYFLLKLALLRLVTATRVAVCVSGQLRTLALQRDDFDFDRFWRPAAHLPRAGDLPFSGPPVAESIHEYLFKKLHHFDVFMHVSTRERKNEPKVGDTSACEPLQPRSNGNNLLCTVERDPKFDQNCFPEVWRTFKYPKRPGLLPQLYGLFRSNEMRKQHTLRSGIQYTYIIRLRPDTLFSRPFPELSSLSLRRYGDPTIGVINPHHCASRVDDLFAVGHVEAMDLYFNRITELLIRKPNGWYENFGTKLWKAESFMIDHLKLHANVTLVYGLPIAACTFKPRSRTHRGEP